MLLKVYSVLFNRNVILTGSIIVGLIFGKFANTLKPLNLYILMLVMTFAMTSIDVNKLFPFNKALKIMAIASFLAYFVFSSFLIALSFLFVKNEMLFYGMIIIAASPPGVAVIPFTHILKGDMNYTMLGTIGAYLASIVLAPLLISIFARDTELDPLYLVGIMVKIIVIPFVLSRLLLLKKIKTNVIKFRGRVVDIGFALIIFIAVGLNSEVFFSDFDILIPISGVIILSMFFLGFVHERISKKFNLSTDKMVSQNLLLTVKSSGFTASTSLIVFGKQAAVPSAVLAVLVLVYLIYLSIRYNRK